MLPVKAKNILAQIASAKEPPGGSNSQTMKPYMINSFFETTLKVGSNQQPMSFVVDTGSSWMWVLSDDCNQRSCLASNNQTFHPLLSTTFRGTNEDKKIVYGNFATEGKRSFDTVAADTQSVLKVD